MGKRGKGTGILRKKTQFKKNEGRELHTPLVAGTVRQILKVFNVVYEHIQN